MFCACRGSSSRVMTVRSKSCARISRLESNTVASHVSVDCTGNGKTQIVAVEGEDEDLEESEASSDFSESM